MQKRITTPKSDPCREIFSEKTFPSDSVDKINALNKVAGIVNWEIERVTGLKLLKEYTVLGYTEDNGGLDIARQGGDTKTKVGIYNKKTGNIHLNTGILKDMDYLLLCYGHEAMHAFMASVDMNLPLFIKEGISEMGGAYVLNFLKGGDTSNRGVAQTMLDRSMVRIDNLTRKTDDNHSELNPMLAVNDLVLPYIDSPIAIASILIKHEGEGIEKVLKAIIEGWRAMDETAEINCKSRLQHFYRDNVLYESYSNANSTLKRIGKNLRPDIPEWAMPDIMEATIRIKEGVKLAEGAHINGFYLSSASILASSRILAERCGYVQNSKDIAYLEIFDMAFAARKLRVHGEEAGVYVERALRVARHYSEPKRRTSPLANAAITCYSNAAAAKLFHDNPRDAANLLSCGIRIAETEGFEREATALTKERERIYPLKNYEGLIRR